LFYSIAGMESSMCALVKVRSKEDPFVSDARIEAAVFRETDAKPGSELAL
jgi:hypothetical protein